MPKLFQYINYIDYNELIHKPIINGVIVEGSKSLADYGIQPAGSYAHLDSNGKVPLSELPDDVFGQLQYQGIWDAERNYPLLPDVPEVKGQYWVVANGGTRFGTDWEKGDWIIAGDTDWQKIDNSDLVVSVNGQNGAVVLTGDDINYNSELTINEAIDGVSADLDDKIDNLKDYVDEQDEKLEEKIEKLDGDYVNESGDTMTGPLIIDAGRTNSLKTSGPILIGGSDKNYETSIKIVRKCQNANDTVNGTKLSTNGYGESFIGHRRSEEDAYIAFDATKLVYGTGGEHGRAVTNVYNIMTSKDTYTKAEVEEIVANLLEQIQNNFATKEELHQATETFVFEQTTPSNEWVIKHNLGTKIGKNRPSVDIVDVFGNVITGFIHYDNDNQITILFENEWQGVAYLN